MTFTVFYAWQSDTDQKVNRFFIRDALKRAIDTLQADATVEDSPSLDHDTRGVAGTPDIFTSILEKISSCGIFVGDVTPVAMTNGKGGSHKHIPNPNVMLETGYAFAQIGDRRVLLILNDAYGAPDELPFDLSRRRWPLRYTIPAGISPTKTQEKELAEKIKNAIREVLKSGSIVNIDEAARRHLRTILFDPNSAVDGVNETSSEFVMVKHLPLSLFSFFQDLPNPHVVCKNSAERFFLDEFVSTYPYFRRASKQLDSYALNKAGEFLKPNNFVGFWKIVAYYAVLLAEGHSEAEALRASQLRNILHDGSDCKRAGSQVIADANFIAYYTEARKYREKICDLVTGLQSESLFTQ